MGGWAILGAPIYTLSAYKGLGDSPANLRKAGLVRAVGSQADGGDVEIPRLKRDVLEGKTKNLTHFRDASSRIYGATRSLTADKVIVVGGECSETVGAMAGLAEAWGSKPGMLWLDAHGDFNTPETSPSGYIGGMCLAAACGRVPQLASGIGQSPPLAGERLVHIGSRALDPAEVEAFNASPAKLYTAQQVRKSGAADVAEEASRHLENRAEWIACHLDVDVMDPEYIPSVNYPTPGGLTQQETSTIIRALLRTGKLRALEVAAYTTSADRRRTTAATLVRFLREVLG